MKPFGVLVASNVVFSVKCPPFSNNNVTYHYSHISNKQEALCLLSEQGGNKQKEIYLGTYIDGQDGKLYRNSTAE